MIPSLEPQYHGNPPELSRSQPPPEACPTPRAPEGRGGPGRENPSFHPSTVQFGHESKHITKFSPEDVRHN